MRYRLQAFIFVLFFSCFLTEVSGALTPTKTLNQFYSTIKKGDISGAMEYVIQPSSKVLNKRLQEQLSSTHSMMASKKGSIVALEHRQVGKWALVIAQYERHENGMRQRLIRDEYVYFQKGKWKAVPKGYWPDPGVIKLLNRDFEKLKKWYENNAYRFDEKYRYSGRLKDPHWWKERKNSNYPKWKSRK